ncbi:hypothetical protein SpCBS45565_g07504 [Spizellomyces sp. 'palustris']|nr:hypothetical protein SpCBS45565_g07504 [Spizellomyces sp. 'palustris']
MESQNRHDAKAILKQDLTSLHSAIQSATSVSTVKRALAEPLALFFDAPKAVNLLTDGAGSSLATVLAASEYFSNIPIESVDLYRDIFFRTCVAQHFEFLLRSVAVSWLPCFSEQEKKTLFESYFIPEVLDSSKGTRHAPPALSVDVLGTLRFLSDTAAWTEHTHVVKVAVDLLQKLLTACRVDDFYVAEMTLQTDGMEAARIERWRQYVAIITFLPDKLANIFGVHPPEFFRTASFISLIAAQIGSAVSSIASRKPVDVPAMYLTELIEKLVRLGYAAYLMESWMPYVKESVSQSDVALLWNAIFQKLGHSESEHLLLQLLESLRKLLSIRGDLTTHQEASKYVLTWIGSQTMEQNPHIRDLLSRKFLYDSVLHVDILRILVRCMAEFPRSSALSVASNIRRLVETWTDKSFLKYASYEQHAHVTYLILLSLSYLTPEDASRADLLGIFLTGMTAYLDSSDPHIRRRGMVTAECLSKVLNLSALDFGLEADEEVTFLRSLADPTTRDGPMGGMSTSSVEVFDVNLQLPEKISDADPEDDPDEIVLPSHNQEGEESSADSDDDLPAYDLREPDVMDADAKILKPPMYIRECLDGLRAEDDPEQLNICLAQASELIERAPQDDLDHIAYDLGSRLIHLHNNFDLSDFDKNRMRALVSLLVRMPRKVSRYLIDQVYERQISIQQRLDILTCLALGATTLSGLQDIGAGEKSDQAPSQDMQVSAPRGRPRPKPVSRPNMFGPVATSFLFPLLTKVHDMIERPNTSGGPFGTLLLTKIIITAGVFVHCAQNTVDNRRLTRDYFNCLWALRYLPLNDTTGLLNAILVGFNVILEALPQSILLDEFGGSTNELGHLREWVSDVLVTDSRRENLQLAASILSSSRNLFDSQRELFWGDAL